MAFHLPYSAKVIFSVSLSFALIVSGSGCSEDKSAIPPKEFAPRPSKESIQSIGGGDSSGKKGAGAGAEQPPPPQ
jgi:hypothetical protein